MTKVLSAITVAIGLLAGARSARPAVDSSWALTHVSVVNVASGRIAAEQTISIRGDRIVGFGPTPTTPLLANVAHVDGSGAFLVPGLFNMHAHLFCEGEDCGSQPRIARYLDSGVLGIRDLGAPLDSIASVARDDALMRPAIWFAGPILDGRRQGPAGSMRLSVENEVQARDTVSTLSKGGVTFIKVHDWLTRVAYFAIVDSARDRRLPVVGHVPAVISLDEAIGAGQKSIEHLGGLTHAVLQACGQPDSALHAEVLRRGLENDKGPAYQLLMSSAYLTPLLNTFDTATCMAVAERLARTHVWQVPTLVMWRAWADSQGTASSEDRSARQRLFDTTRRIVGIMYRSGVPILAGTDEIPGTTIHDELELLVSAGLPSVAALQAATSKAAEFLGVGDSYGSITPGHLANFVLVEGNPFTDIRNLRHIRMTVLRGQQVPKSQP